VLFWGYLLHVDEGTESLKETKAFSKDGNNTLISGKMNTAKQIKSHLSHKSRPK
jgi:hypothetical protein